MIGLRAILPPSVMALTLIAVCASRAADKSASQPDQTSDPSRHWYAPNKDSEQAIINVPWATMDPTANLPSDDPDYQSFYQKTPKGKFPELRDRYNPAKRQAKAFEFQKIDYPTGEDNPTAYRFDMGPAGSPLQAGYTPVTREDVFSWKKGWGWEGKPAADFSWTGLESNTPLKILDLEILGLNRLSQAFKEQGKEFDRAAANRLHNVGVLYDLVLDDLSRDAVSNPGEIVFKVALPNGRYTVSLILGDLQIPRYGMEVYANGERVAPVDAPLRVETGGNLPWPARVTFNVNVRRNNLRLAVRANDNLYEERARVSAAPPIYNYSELPYVMGLPGKNPSPYFGRPVELTGPATQMAITGLSIAPYERPKVELVRQRMELSPEATDENLRKGAEAFNRGDLAGAAADFEKLSANDPALKASALLALAGHLETSDGDELKWIDEAMELLGRALKANPENIRADDLRRALRTYRAGLCYFIYLFDPNMKMPNPPPPPPVTQDSQAQSWHRQKYGGLFTWIQPGETLFAKSLMRFGRYIAVGDPHRHGSSYPAAENAFLHLQDEAPGNRFSDYYLYWNTKGWEIKDYSKGLEGAPKWAGLMREAYNRLLDHAEWWGEFRQQADGSLGGGWGDDVEICTVWQIAALINPDASPRATETVRAIAEGVWWSGEIDRDTGFYDGISDVEHTAEWTADSQTMMMGIDYGNPAYFERNLKIGKLMRDVWMGETPRKHLHFKSMVLGNKKAGGRYAGVLDTDIDCPLNGRAAWPAFWDWWYSPVDGLDDLFGRWAGAWLEDSMRAENGKPASIIPGPIGYKTDTLGGNTAAVWRQGAPSANSYENPSYAHYVLALFSQMFSRSGDSKWLAPRAAKLTSEGVDVEEATPVPNAAKGHVIQDKYAKLKELNLEYSLDVARKTWPSITSENSNTDRIAMPGLNAIVELLTGGNIEYGLNHIPMTLKNTSRDAAFMNLASSERFAKTIFYNFGAKAETAGLVLWGLQIGAEHEIKIGVDNDDDDEIDEVLQTFQYTHVHRGDSIECKLPPRKTIVMEVRQTKAGAGMPKRVVDLALSPWDVEYKDGKLLVTVHNLGNLDCGPFTVTVRQGADRNGKVLETFHVDRLEAPNDLEPRAKTLSLDWEIPGDSKSKGEPRSVHVEAHIDGNDYEITERNNAATAPLADGRPSYRTPRLWKTLAAEHGLKQWDPFPSDFPKDQIR